MLLTDTTTLKYCDLLIKRAMKAVILCLIQEILNPFGKISLNSSQVVSGIYTQTNYSSDGRFRLVGKFVCSINSANMMSLCQLLFCVILVAGSLAVLKL